MNLLKARFEEDGIEFETSEQEGLITITARKGAESLSGNYQLQHLPRYGYDAGDVAGADAVIDGLKGKLQK